MSRALPDWARKILPVDMEEAAALLGCSRRFLVDVIRDYPHFERRGTRKVFYPEHIALLREAIGCRNSRSNGVAGSLTPLEPLMESAYEKALKLAMRKERKSNVRSTKRGSGNVITMVRKP